MPGEVSNFDLIESDSKCPIFINERRALPMDLKKTRNNPFLNVLHKFAYFELWKNVT